MRGQQIRARRRPGRRVPDFAAVFLAKVGARVAERLAAQSGDARPAEPDLPGVRKQTANVADAIAETGKS